MTSPRTQKYVQALIGEGEKFDHSSWLKQVRLEEAIPRKDDGLVASGNTLLNKAESAESGDSHFARNRKNSVLDSVRQRTPRQIFRLRPPRLQNKKRSLTQRLASVEAAWKAMKSKHKRNAIYGYLSVVFKLVEWCRRRRQIKKLIQCIVKSTGLPTRNDVDPVAAVIRCTCDSNIDRKTISRWSRALRYVAERKPPETPLKTFMQRKGGINACADRFARLRKHRAAQ